MPPYLRSALTALGVPFVDVWVHPIRFLDDLLLGVRSSDPASDAAIRGHAVSEDEVWMTAGLRRATVTTSPYSVLDPDTTLFLAQARMDKSQVFDGRFVDAGAFDDDLRRLAAEPGPWLLKPPPYDPDHPLTARVRELVPRARTVTDNVYHLFAQDEVTRVVSLNSSAAIEARYFGKRVTLLIPPVIEVGYRGGTGSPYWSLDHRLLDPDFWRQALAPLVPTTPPDGFRHAPKPNRLRIALHSFWGFQQIDTDAFVHIARPPGGDTGHVPIPSAAGQSANLLPVLHLLHPAEGDRVGRFVLLPGREEPRIEVYGPYATRPADRYRLTIRSRAAAAGSFFADVCFDYSNSFLLPRADIHAGGAWEAEFEVAEATPGIETRLWSSRTEVRIDAVELACLRLGPVPPPAQTA